MGLNNAMGAALSGMRAQTASISNISNNLSNIGTTAYKKSNVTFSTMVSNKFGSPYSTSSGIGSGVKSTLRPLLNQQGILANSTSSTDMAIDGSGFFITKDTAGGKSLNFTRDGTFELDRKGFLVNKHGQYLMGLPTDKQGKALGSIGAVNNLKTLNIKTLGGVASATANLGITANVPAQAAVNGTFTRDVEVYDSLGTAHIIKSTWKKTAANQWNVSFSNPVLASNSSKTTGTIAGSVNLTFDSSGKLKSTAPSPAKVSVTGWSTGAKNSSINIDLSKVSQFSSAGNAKLEVKTIQHDGTQFGEYKSMSVGADGLVVASFTNGKSYPIFKIPLATFANPNGLKAVGNNAYGVTAESGNYTVHNAGSGGAGKVLGSRLERSNVDSAKEMTELISAQQAYSASAEVISATNQLHKTLMRVQR